MTENKRFENRLNKDIKKFNTLNPVWDNEKQDALNVFEMIDSMNDLNDENKTLKKQIEDLEFALRTELAHQRVEKKGEEFSDTVYDFKKKLDTW